MQTTAELKGQSTLLQFLLNFSGSHLQFRIDFKMLLITAKEHFGRAPSQRSPGKSLSVILHLKLKSNADLTVNDISGNSRVLDYLAKSGQILLDSCHESGEVWVLLLNWSPSFLACFMEESKRSVSLMNLFLGNACINVNTSCQSFKPICIGHHCAVIEYVRDFMDSGYCDQVKIQFSSMIQYW